MNYTNNMKREGHKYYILNDEWTATTVTAKSGLFPELSLKIITNEKDFSTLHDEWNELVLKSSSSIYQTFEWQFYWWKYFASDNQYTLHIIQIYLSGKLIGIAPFFIQNYSIKNFRIFQRLRLIGCGLNLGESSSNAIEEDGLSDYLDIISDKSYQSQTAYSVTAYLKEFNNLFDEIDFQNISQESFIYNYVIPLLGKNDFFIKMFLTDICPKLKVPASLDLYLQMVKSNTRRRLRQSLKQTNEDSICIIEDVFGFNFQSAFQHLKQLHQKRWNELGYLGLFSDERFGKFQDQVCKKFIEKGWLWFKVLKQNNKIIAARLGFNFNNSVYDYLSGFDNSQSSAAIRPGMILILSMIDFAIDKGMQTVDFLRGAEEYKSEISTSVSHNYRAIIKSSATSGIIKNISFIIIKNRNSVMHRLRFEKSIINLHIKQYGLKTFLSFYIKFCFGRLKSLLFKHSYDREWKPKASKFNDEQKNPSKLKEKHINLKTRKKEVRETEIDV